MSKLNQFIKLAKKAMDASSSSSSSTSSQRGSSSTDWMAKARGAVDSLLGDERRPSSTAYPASGAAYPPAANAHTGAPQPPAAPYPPAAPRTSASRSARTAPSGSPQDRAAIARYDYLLQTARPDQIEQVHREAFARLTPEQRAQVAERMRSELPPYEHPRSYDAPELARVAARAEAAQPGRLRGLLARTRGVGIAGGVAAGGLAVGGVLAAVAGGAILTSVGSEIIGHALGAGVDFDALAEGVDVSAIAESAGGFASEAGEFTQGIGDQVSEAGGSLGDLASEFGLGDLFGR